MKFSRVVAVVGFKKSGKTRVVNVLVRELTRRGYRVSTAKHIGEPNFTIDEEGRDTWKHAQAGANIVLCLADHEFVRIEREKKGIEKIAGEFQGQDFFILEGFKELGNVARVAVLRDSFETKELVNDLTLACVGAKVASIPSFSFDQVSELADLVEKKVFPPLPGLDCGHCGHKTCEELGRAIIAGRAKWNVCTTLRERSSVTVNGKPVPLNPFVQELVAQITKAVVTSLKHAEGKEVVIEVSLDEG